MRVYSVRSKTGRRFLDGVVPAVGERKKCLSCGRMNVNYPPPEKYWNKVKLSQGSFVSSIFWTILTDFYVIEELKDAFQEEGFEGIEFGSEAVEIVEDNREWRDRKKLPLDQIPPFYRVKLLTNIPIHQDFVDLYNMKTCPECGREQVGASNHVHHEAVIILLVFE